MSIHRSKRFKITNVSSSQVYLSKARKKMQVITKIKKGIVKNEQ
jgi:hypothetical protein